MIFHFYPRTFSREVASIKKRRGGEEEGGGGVGREEGGREGKGWSEKKKKVKFVHWKPLPQNHFN